MQDATIKKLHDATFTLTALVTADDRYAHMRKPLEMVVGGLIMKAIADIDPTQLGDEETMKELIEKYSPEAVAEWFEPELSESSPQLTALIEELREANEQLAELREQKAPKVEAPKVEAPKVEAPKVEAPKVEAPKVEAPVVSTPRQRKPAKVKVDQCYDGKDRRIKGQISKQTKQERELAPYDRDHIIRWWNAHQRLMYKDDAECVYLVKTCGTNISGKLLAPAQVAGCISQIARKALWSSQHRNSNIEWNLKHGTYMVRPEYPRALIDSIVANYKAQRKDEDKRGKDHADILNKRAGRAPKTTTPPATPEPAVMQVAQATPEATPTDHIKYLAST